MTKPLVVKVPLDPIRRSCTPKDVEEPLIVYVGGRVDFVPIHTSKGSKTFDEICDVVPRPVGIDVFDVF